MNNRDMLFAPLGDSAVVVTLGASIDAGSLAAVSELTSALRSAALAGVTDVVPAYATVTVFYDPARWAGDGGTPYEKICAGIAAAAKKSAESNGKKTSMAGAVARRVEIPVCYGGEYGPDLDEVATHTRLTGAEVIARHSGAEYQVQAIGFSPGFPYLSGLPPELVTPRRSTARISVPAGSVGIGGAQTGVYPLASPGGWRLIGRTPLKLFDPVRAAPAWLRVGDVVVFRPVTPKEFSSWK